MTKKVTTNTYQKMKKEKQKISMLTAYDYPTAKLIDESGIDSILVGDSLGSAVLGYEDTTQVTMEDMIHHSRAVARGAKRALVVVDMPFLSIHLGKEEAVYNAGRLMQEGKAQAVKIEGGQEVADIVKAITRAGIPVMGHIGLTPQQVHQMGGYFVQGRTEAQATELIADALALQEAGAFSIVLELIPAELATIVSEKLTIPTIGIGAGAGCDGQVLVVHDMLGLFQGNTPSFAKKYADLTTEMKQAFGQYHQEVTAGTFPTVEHERKLDPEVYEKLINQACEEVE